MTNRASLLLAILLAAPIGGDGMQLSAPPQIASLAMEARQRAEHEFGQAVDDIALSQALDVIVEALRRDAEQAPWTLARFQHERSVWGAVAGELIRVRHRDARWVRAGERTGYPDFVLEMHGPQIGERLDPFRLADTALRGRSQGLSFAVDIFSLDCHLE